MARAGETKVRVPTYVTLDAYRHAGGYELLDEVRTAALSVAAVIDAIEKAGLKGLGGAGFPAGKKWGFVKSYPGPRLMTVNGDEGEPGTFKDRYYLERDPHRALEGAMIAAHAIEAERIYVYMRDEYPAVLDILRREIAALESAGIAAPGFIELRRGAGAYICGEESAMIESIEGKRGLPRNRPPYVAEVGLFGRPTLNHNVETLWWIRDIVEKGPDWFAAHGKPGHPGLRSWSVSGRVADPGVKLAPAGVTVRELIDGYCGGMAEGHLFKAYLPGGASGGILPASMARHAARLRRRACQARCLRRVACDRGILGQGQRQGRDDQPAEVLPATRAAASARRAARARARWSRCCERLPGPRRTCPARSGDGHAQTLRSAASARPRPNPVNHLLVHFREDI